MPRLTATTKMRVRRWAFWLLLALTVLGIWAGNRGNETLVLLVLVAMVVVVALAAFSEFAGLDVHGDAIPVLRDPEHLCTLCGGRHLEEDCPLPMAGGQASAGDGEAGG